RGAVMTQKRKLMTLRDYAKVRWEPWQRTPKMHPAELLPRSKQWNDVGITARMAYALMLLSRDQLIESIRDPNNDAVSGQIMERLADVSDKLKGIITMIDAAHARYLALHVQYSRVEPRR